MHAVPEKELSESRDEMQATSDQIEKLRHSLSETETALEAEKAASESLRNNLAAEEAKLPTLQAALAAEEKARQEEAAGAAATMAKLQKKLVQYTSEKAQGREEVEKLDKALKSSQQEVDDVVATMMTKESEWTAEMQRVEAANNARVHELETSLEELQQWQDL